MDRSTESAHGGADPATVEDRIRQLEAQMEALTEAVGVLARGLEGGPMAEPRNQDTEEAARHAHELLLLAKSKTAESPGG
jgi:hypothetical protein